MKRTLGIAAIAALTAAGMSTTPAQAAPAEGPPRATAAAGIFPGTTKADPEFTPTDRSAALRTASREASATAVALRLPDGQRLKASDAIADTNGDTHIRYQRTYDGLPVVGGDLVVHEDKNGAIVSADYASRANITLLSTRPRLAAPAARSVLVVFASNHRPVLAWETHRRRPASNGDPIDRLSYTDARTGRRLAVRNRIDTVDGRGASLYSGAVTFSTVLSGSSYRLTDATRGGASIYDANNSTSTSRGTLFTDADNTWGNGSTTSRQSAAVDAAYGAANTWDFYMTTFGRSGIRNDGAAAYSRVHYGKSYENAFWSDSCFCMTYGDGGSSLTSLVSLDVAGHEMSHGVTSNTAGLIYSGESGGLNESTSDIFGTMVEFAANNASDRGDYYIGEKVVRDGTYLRRMDNPSLDGGSANCWYSGVGSLGVHYSSGVGNHFFYLLAEGSGAKTIGGRGHKSPTCNGSTLGGIGRDAAAKIWYRALTIYMTSTTNYSGARDATIKAARDLYGATSPQCSAVVATWDAVSVPFGAESCGTPPPPPPSGNLLANPGFESGLSAWSQTSGVISTGGSSGPRTGAYVAWMNGYGTTHTDTLSQSVTVPSGKTSASLSFYLKVSSSETTTTRAYDTLRVQAISGGTTTTLATYSNLDKQANYVQRTVNLNPYIAKTVTVRFVGAEDSAAATSFRLDDTSVTTA